jgi:multisubunit Na+/H+ antiporter MnhF subunit
MKILTIGMKIRGDQMATQKTTQSRINPTVSANYSLAKVFSLLLIVIGHWSAANLLWIPVTFGLFVFAFSSGFFTTKIYGTDLNVREFWTKKLQRLGLRFWVSLVFISIVTTWQGGTVLHWHSLVHLAGMSGIINWLSIPNRSSLGPGLWFFTLLLFFYVSYPFLVRVFASERWTYALVILLTILAAVLDQSVKVGHALWPTALGFISGVALGRFQPNISALAAAASATILCISLATINILTGIKSLNSILICMTCIAIVIWLLKVTFPTTRIGKIVASADAYLLEIFLIHTFVFVHPTGNGPIDLILSLVLILLASVALNSLVVRLSALVFTTRPNRVAPF